MEYVLGFAFIPPEIDEDDKSVVLIRKEAPDWQKGLLNGVGGKMEPFENPHDAMKREFTEETGVEYYRWEQFAIMHFRDSVVRCFVAASHSFRRCTTTTNEQVLILPLHKVREYEHIDNIPMLIEMALQAHKQDLIMLKCR